MKKKPLPNKVNTKSLDLLRMEQLEERIAYLEECEILNDEIIEVLEDAADSLCVKIANLEREIQLLKMNQVTYYHTPTNQPYLQGTPNTTSPIMPLTYCQTNSAMYPM